MPVRKSFPLLSLIIVLGIVLLNTSCSQLSNLSATDFSKSYSVGEHGNTIKIKVRHVTDSVSELYVRFPARSENQGKMAKGAAPGIHYRLNYQLYPSFSDPSILDSSSFEVHDSLLSAFNPMIRACRVKAYIGKAYLLRMEIADVYSNRSQLITKNFSKTSHSSAPWLCFRDSKDQLLFEEYLAPNEGFSLETTLDSITRIACRCFFREFPAAMPPFVTKERALFDYRTDSLFFIDLVNGKSPLIRLQRAGFFLFQTDTSNWDGLPLIQVYPDYPKVNTSYRMIEPTRYLTSQEEFRNIVTAPYPKEALDSFWITNSGGVDKALEYIRNYYNRVEAANSLFLSFCEGWKTDRGMIYLIFGPPNLVYRSDTEELWTYGEKNNYRSLQFLFYKVDNPFTDNDYVLQRQSNYKPYWYNAVQQWRR